MNHTSKLFLLCVLAFGVLDVARAADSVKAEASQVAIAPQPLGDALEEWAVRYGKQVMFDADLAAGITTQGVAAGLSEMEALSRLLEGTGLVYRVLNERTISILPREKAVGSAQEGVGDVRLTQSETVGTQKTGSSLEGDMGERKEIGRDEDSRVLSQDETFEEVVVTGSRIKRQSEGPAPMTVFDRERIEQLGATDIADVLDYLPQQPFSQNERSTFGGTREVRLRGLGSGTTLVLINGRRTTVSALMGASNAFDLNSIPLGSVERIEVLSGSASAIYGADAIGGVVNVITKTKPHDATVNVYYGAADGGADERKAAVTFGHAGPRFHASTVLDLFDRDVLLGSERDLSSNQDYRRFGSIDRRSSVTNPGNISSLTAANLPGLDARFAAVPTGISGVGITPGDFQATAGLRNLDSLTRFAALVPETQRLGAALSGELELGGSTNGFGEFVYSHREDVRTLSPPSFSNLTVPASNPFNPFGVDVVANFLFTTMERVSSNAEADSFRTVAGLRGEVAEWEYEISVLGTDEDAKSWVENNVDRGQVAAALANPDPSQALNPFQDGPGGSASMLASLVQTSPPASRSSSKAQQGSAFVRGSLLDLPAGSVEAVLGGEVRKERLYIQASSTNAYRRSSATYSELRIPLLTAKAPMRSAQQLTLTMAARYDHYSDFGGTFNPQYGLEWNPWPRLLLRASYGTSFRPPSLVELYSPAAESFSSITDHRRNGETAIYRAFSGGNPELDAEEAESLNAGLVYEIDSTPLRVAATYWRIQQKQKVQALSTIAILANEDLFPDRVVRAASTPADVSAGLPGPLISVDVTSMNFGRVKTSGVDVELSTSLDAPSGWGVFHSSLSATWVDSFMSADTPRSPEFERVGIANVNGTVPKWRATGTLGWNRAGTGVSLSGRYVAAYDDASQLLGVSTGRIVGSQILADLHVSMDLSPQGDAPSWREGVQVRGGVLNLFDREPRFAEVGGALGYDSSQGDVRQRFAYMSISKSF